MKRNYVQTLGVLVSLLFWCTSSIHANETPLVKTVSEDAHPPLTCNEKPVFEVKICFNYLLGSVCVTLDCDLHWTDAIQPGLGQLFGHNGCRLAGSASNPTSGINTAFQGSSEDMLAAIEKSTGVPKGSLRDLLIITSPTFPTPDGDEYRVVAKKYPVLKGANGRYLALEFEKAK